MKSIKVTDQDFDLDDSFRDSISTVDKDGKRIWLYPRNPSGKLTNWRSIVSWILVLVMVGTPFIKVNGAPFMLFNILERKFILFGKVFLPHDYQILLFIFLAGVVFIFLFTIVYGRVFCGWICPQTIFMEHIFRKVEFWIEGDYKARITLDKSDWTATKVLKKTAKHAVFLLISYFIANVFLSYVLGLEKVFNIWSAPLSQPTTLLPFIVFTLIFYWVFAKFREQVCTTVCPYGRLQGVLQDKNTLMVIYDYVRGEKRAKWRANESRETVGKGACIDCGHCVTVCPMGIDIRNGTQLECTNCTACIDACNFIMNKTGQPEGLIRIGSESKIAANEPFKFTGRTIGYTVIMIALLGFIVTLLVLRSEIDSTMLRTPGILYQELPNNKVSNLYNLKLVNKTANNVPVEFKLIGHPGEVKLVGKDITIPKEGSAETAAFIILNKKDIKNMKTKLKIGIFSEGRQIETISTTFIGPKSK